MTSSIYQLPLTLFTESMIPVNKRTDFDIAYLTQVNSQMGWLNQNLNEYIYGSDYTYYSSTASYSYGDRVNGGLIYQNNVYEYIGPSAAGGAILSSNIATFSRGGFYNVGDKFSVDGGSSLAIGMITSVYEATGLTIVITSVSSGIVIGASISNPGIGYQVDYTIAVNSGFSNAILSVLTVNGSGGVLTFTIINGGTGNVVTGIPVTTSVGLSQTGEIRSYVLISEGAGYKVGTASTTRITGGGIGLYLNILSVGGAAALSDTRYWELVNNNFIGIKERAYYVNNKLSLEWNLNRVFNTNFAQPNGVTMSTTHSDIFISDNNPANSNVFLMYQTPFLSSAMTTRSSSGYMFLKSGITSSIVDSNLFTVFVPAGVMATLPSGSQSITTIVNKYNYVGISYDVKTY